MKPTSKRLQLFDLSKGSNNREVSKDLDIEATNPEGRTIIDPIIPATNKTLD
jgi:hypothetical protein